MCYVKIYKYYYNKLVGLSLIYKEILLMAKQITDSDRKGYIDVHPH